MILAAAPAGATTGTAILMIALAVGIFVGIKSKKLTVTELLVCGSFGLLLGTTALGAQLLGPLGQLGSWINGLAG